MPLGYKLVGEVNVTSPTTQVDFTGLNFNKDDVLLLVTDAINATASFMGLDLFVNDDVVTSNYYSQQVFANGTTIGGLRGNTASYGGTGANNRLFSRCHIKVTELGLFAYQSYNSDAIGSNNLTIVDTFGSKIATITSITKLSIIASVTNSIASGSRFKLYKLIAEPLADITVISDATQVDINGLNLDETNEVLLVSDIENQSGSTSDYSLYVNGDTVATNYNEQELTASNTAINAARVNDAVIARLETADSLLSFAMVKKTNGDHFAVQSNVIRRLGATDLMIQKNDSTKTATISSITSLSIVSSVTNAIRAGSRFKLYKLR